LEKNTTGRVPCCLGGRIRKTIEKKKARGTLEKEGGGFRREGVRPGSVRRKKTEKKKHHSGRTGQGGKILNKQIFSLLPLKTSGEKGAIAENWSKTIKIQTHPRESGEKGGGAGKKGKSSRRKNSKEQKLLPQGIPMLSRDRMGKNRSERGNRKVRE